MSDFEAEGTLPVEDNPPGISGDNDIEGEFPPGDRPRASTDWGTTAREERMDEPLADRVRREVPDRVRAGDEPVGRLVAPDEGMIDVDDEPAEIATMTGDDAGLSAEEAAMHITDSP
ncbi:MAG TPA: DUF5709 domain-containing protein [Acidimicrobiales bacterium]|jgi:hypothetical protein|nr:DUF5709 domain-containing protein [Acidimicrobiales bacterium]